jgi:hypothetical protein
MISQQIRHSAHVPIPWPWPRKVVAPGKEFDRDRCMRECLGACHVFPCPFAGCAIDAAVFEGGAGEQLEFDFETRH